MRIKAFGVWKFGRRKFHLGITLELNCAELILDLGQLRSIFENFICFGSCKQVLDKNEGHTKQN